jgi:class 3 adenylate cyclase
VTARKTVTVVFADVVGSTSFAERRDPEVSRRILDDWYADARALLERHGGLVEKFIGDAVMAVFGVPVAREDDALRAVRAASELQQLEAPLLLRIGVNTGEVAVGNGETLVTGDAVNVAARLEQLGAPGDVLIGDTTAHLVAAAVVTDAVELEVQGREEPVHAHRLVSVLPDAEPFARRFETPLVGRRSELDAVLAAYERARTGQACELVTILGDPGIGKSKLAREVVELVAPTARVLSGRCLPYGEGITYWPLVGIMNELTAAGLEVEDVLGSEPDGKVLAERIGTAVGTRLAVASTDEIFAAVKRLLQRLAQERPLVLVLDDLQWAEPTFLDLVEYVANSRSLLILGIARSELFELRPRWPGTHLHLQPLSPIESEELVRLLGGDETGRAVAAAEGNPLFLEQLLALSDAEGVPPTISALLQSRLDRLTAQPRRVIEAASVIGQGFWLGAVRTLAGGDPDVVHGLLELVRQGFVSPIEPQAFPDEDAYAFRHILVRDAAYATIGKEARAVMHERFVEWVEQKQGEQKISRAEILGYHLEQAVRYRQELEIVDAATERTAERASDLLAAAGERASVREDAPAAVSLFERALDLLPVEAPKRLERQIALAAAMRPIGPRERELSLLRSTLAAAHRIGDRRVEWLARIEQRIAADPEGPLRAPIAEEAAEAVKVFRELGEERGAALAGSVLAYTSCWKGRIAAGVEASMRALEEAFKSGDLRTASMAAGIIRGFLFVSPHTVAESLHYLDRIRTLLLGSPLLWDLERAYYLSLTGDFEQARELLAPVRPIFEERGLVFAQMDAASCACMIEWLAGDLRGAAEEGERALAIGAKHEEHPWERILIAAQLAQIRLELGELQGAQALLDTYEEHAEGLLRIQMLAVHALLLVKRGDVAAGLELAEDAVSAALATDSPTLQGQAFVARAQALAAASRSVDAQRDLEDGARLFERKGAAAWAAKVRQLGPVLSPEASAGGR